MVIKLYKIVQDLKEFDVDVVRRLLWCEVLMIWQMVCKFMLTVWIQFRYYCW